MPSMLQERKCRVIAYPKFALGAFLFCVSPFVRKNQSFGIPLPGIQQNILHALHSHTRVIGSRTIDHLKKKFLSTCAAYGEVTRRERDETWNPESDPGWPVHTPPEKLTIL